MAFNVPITSLPTTPTPADWVRPSDWPVITDAPNEVQFLVCDVNTKAFTIRTTFTRTSGNIYIDWGDGVTDTISTTTQVDTSHVYSTGGTPCSRGYNTWKIRIYGDATCVITNARHIANSSATGGNPLYNIGLLESYFGNNTCNTTAFYANYYSCLPAQPAGLGAFQYLEYVKLPATVSWTSQMSGMFTSCGNLYKVIMPTSASGLTSMASAFQDCRNLLDIAIPSNSTSITTFSNAFLNCRDLRTFLLPSTLNSCTTFSSCWSGCVSLKNITLPSINLATTLLSAFDSCASLLWVKFTSLPAPASGGTAITATSMFSGCSSLQNVYFPSSCSSNAIYTADNFVQNCVNLRNINFPTNFNASTFQQAFLGCIRLVEVVMPSSMSSLTNINQAFSSCRSLTSITLPTTVGASISMIQTFVSCSLLQSITIPSSYNITSLSNTFIGCTNLQSIVLPNNSQNSCTSMQSMCTACYALESIVMPTSLTGITGFGTGSIFSGCYNLISVTFPSTINSSTSLQNTFQDCYKLTSVTLPTSMSACTNFNNTFLNCQSLESLTLPSTVSSSATTFAGMVQYCYNLKTLTLPTTQTSSVNSINRMFEGCGNLTTINNLNKIGSLTATPLVNGLMASSSTTTSYIALLTSLSFGCPFSGLNLSGSTTTFSKLNSLRLLNAGAGQYTGSTPHINVSYCDLGISALNQLFTDLPTITSKTINITGCTGAAGCTRSIATAKGWTVTG